ncbi:MAG TPA: CNP1-like family protein [Burkholderiales bacterium]|nr:CNP1-like family protein [Burkholderiales bacterium]
MKPRISLVLAAAIAAAACSGPAPLVSADQVDDPASPQRAKVEPEVKLPPFPKEQTLIRYDVTPKTSLEYFVDSTSITLPGEGLVRFTVVAKNASAENVSYEGFRCSTREHKIYARANRDGAWVIVKGASWEPVSERTTQMFRRELYWNFFCPGKHTINTPREGVDALRFGRHPDARPEGSMAY